MRIGAALEEDTTQYADGLDAEAIDFVEYGIHSQRGAPLWLCELRERLGIPLHLHPLDVNLSEALPSDAWLAKMADIVQRLGVSALVADCGFWYLGNRSATWERPPDFGVSGRAASRIASAIAQACGIPFRLENPPVDWMPREPSIWRWLDEISTCDGVEICLDLCHLIQFIDNVAKNDRQLPREFPWRRVTEMHLGGVIYVEYRGAALTFDQHLAEIDSRQWRLLEDIVALNGTEVDVCLEMEPQSTGQFRSVAATLRRRMAVL